jgi:hypothetical protein
MSYINVTTKMFFDKPGVVAAMSRKTQRVLSSTGAFTRQTMKRGMRKRKGVSAIGDYPSAHGNSLLRSLIYFGYDDATQSVVIGPTLIRNDSSILSNVTVPQLINEGGTIQRRVFRRRKNSRLSGYVTETQRYRPRPFVALTTPVAAKKLADNMAKFELKKGV